MRTNTKKQILHLTPHLGAGVGTVVLNYLSHVSKHPCYAHNIVCLDYANPEAIKTAKKFGFTLLGDMSKKKEDVLRLIGEADVVLIHWWNHPLLYDFLIREQMPPSRILIWGHISGANPPNNFTDKILKYPDRFIFTTPLSYNVPEVENLSRAYKKRLGDIWSTGGLDRVQTIKLKKHSGFNIGYIGNVDYAKLHPDFLEMSNNAGIPEATFIVVGGPNGKQIKEEAKSRGIQHKFKFTGFVSEAKKWQQLSTFDLFGYPLAPHHYGTCDQAIQESMAVGVVPVVLGNPMESYMVKDGVTGIVAQDKKAYAKALVRLYRDKQLRQALSRNAKTYAMRTFSMNAMEKQWETVFKEALTSPKLKQNRRWDFQGKLGDISPKDIFIESLGTYANVFVAYCRAKNSREQQMAEKNIKKLALSANWRSQSKSSVHQYDRFFPGDPFLSAWSKLMR